MLRKIFQRTSIALAAGILCLSDAPGELREFSNEDGSKTFKAELVNYQPLKKLVEVERESGKRIKFRLDAVSKKDQAYILNRAPLLEIAYNLKVNGRIDPGKKEVTKSPPFKTTKTPKAYRLSFRNNSQLPIQDLTIDYAIHWTKDSGTGRKGELKKVLEGSSTLSAVLPLQEVSLTTEAVDVIYKQPYGST